VAEDLGSRPGYADDVRIDNRQHGDAQALANLTDLAAAQLLLDRAIRIADDAKLAAGRCQPLETLNRASHRAPPQVDRRTAPHFPQPIQRVGALIRRDPNSIS